MERKDRTYSRILGILIFISTTICSCSERYADTRMRKIDIRADCTGIASRSESINPEDIIHDIGIWAFHEGNLEAVSWTTAGEEATYADMSLDLISGRKYILCILANIGNQIEIRSLAEMMDLQIPIGETQRKGHRIPMGAFTEIAVSDMTGPIDVRLERMMAKVSVRMDRNGLYDDVSMNVRKVSICNYPVFVKAFGTNSTSDSGSCVTNGVSLNREECSPLNNGGSISLFVPENIRGRFLPYLEMEMSYLSKTQCSSSGNLIYRVHIGESPTDLNIERNCHYRITVSPEGDGLNGTGWKIDKSGIGSYTPSIKLYPGTYMECRVGEMLHIRCETVPEETVIDIGYEELEYEKERGMFDYEVDEDGKGAVLYLKRPGTAIVYMTAGPPVNDSVMGIIAIYP